jgi:hypothetical protein
MVRMSGTHAQRLATTSLWMLAVFAVWTALFIGLSGPIADALGYPTSSGEVVYIEAWLPWLAVTVLWVLPLLAGLGLARAARKQGAGSRAQVAQVVHGVLLIVLVLPSLVDRLVNL